eukprot:11155978-Lingulodinium_polyedra.AAC.1
MAVYPGNTANSNTKTAVLRAASVVFQKCPAASRAALANFHKLMFQYGGRLPRAIWSFHLP